MHALLLLFACLALGFALPAPLAGSGAKLGLAVRDDSAAADTLAKQLVTIASGTSSCATATNYANECRTASQAAQPILCAFNRYSITNVNEQAALISLMLYESGEFKYNWGHFINGQDEHVAGKGTRNMQSATYNEQYARTLFSADKVDQAKASANGADAVLQLVSPDQYSFGSAAWFLTSQCTESVRSNLQSGSQDGFEKYVTDCIGGSMDDKRIDYWTKSKAALAG
ncbi:hypothetical protein B0J12DRAFT_708343 [Macrophomina phaseolina]|uniref:Uncharacterized protein n=1 Tax=Macrophomina phaseolina TaxID=35725 RepID=A0ABQ8GLI1_9PEZI|nr:hypothetical protein B0J12DRAFT_708343 [Macrophomina phaseolina]